MEIKIDQVSITKGELNAADTTQDIPLIGITPHTYILGFFARVRTAFTGVTAPSVTVGLGSGGTELVKSQLISQAGDIITGGSLDNKSFCPRLPPIPITGVETGKKIVATFTSSSGNFTSLSAGEIEFVTVYVA